MMFNDHRLRYLFKAHGFSLSLKFSESLKYFSSHQAGKKMADVVTFT